jgi:uroporphyrinogen-III synthase
VSRSVPLEGRTVAVTRPTDRSSELVNVLDDLGARTLVAPTIEIAPVRSAALTRRLEELAAGGFAWITLTSANTVVMLQERLRGPVDVRAKVAAIGEGTAEAFRAWADREPDLIAPTFTTTGLARAFPRGTGRVLCARADIAPPGLEDALAAKGWTPARVDAYRTRLARSLPPEAREAFRARTVDAVTFTSASTVRGFVRATTRLRDEGLLRGVKVVCIGPVTSKEARANGLRVHAVASPHTIEGVAEAVVRALAPRRT